MTIAYWCVLAMIMFPYIFTTLAKTGPHFKNQDPRGYLQKLTGWRKRADYVQLNSFESTPAFGIAVIIAHLGNAPQSSIDKLAIAFVLIRIIYAICYLWDKPSLRSLFWALGLACVIGFFYLAA